MGISDLPRTARFKIFCSRCEEVYIPKARSINVDGACFGTSFPHVFLKQYPNAVILPPKVYLYEPKICGFNIYGKRGSKFFKPASEHGAVRTTDDGLRSRELERRDKEVLALISANATKRSLSPQVVSSAPLARQEEEGKEAKKKKNRNKKNKRH